jgi:hypothetical protein
MYPVIVDRPTARPQACICGSQLGPTVDTGIERYDERIYLCPLCVTAILRLVDSERCPVQERDVALETAKRATLRAELAEEDVRVGIGVSAELKRAQDDIEVLRAENVALRQAAVPAKPVPAEVFKAAMNAKPKRVKSSA